MNGTTSLFPHAFALSTLLRKNSYALPWKAFVPDFVTTSTWPAALRPTRGVLAAQRLDFGDGIHTGISKQRKVGSAIHVVGAVNGPVIGGIARAVDREVHDARRSAGSRRSHRQLIGRAAIDDTGLQREKLLW